MKTIDIEKRLIRLVKVIKQQGLNVKMSICDDIVYIDDIEVFDFNPSYSNLIFKCNGGVDLYFNEIEIKEIMIIINNLEKELLSDVRTK